MSKSTPMAYLYKKETHTGQYINFERYTMWNHKIAMFSLTANRLVPVIKL